MIGWKQINNSWYYFGSDAKMCIRDSLQFFITVGPIGLLSYLAIFVTAFIRIIKKGCQNPYVIAAMFGVLCYSAQATVNIGTPITIPIMFLFLSMALAGCREA